MIIQPLHRSFIAAGADKKRARTFVTNSHKIEYDSWNHLCHLSYIQKCGCVSTFIEWKSQRARRRKIRECEKWERSKIQKWPGEGNKLTMIPWVKSFSNNFIVSDVWVVTRGRISYGRPERVKNVRSSCKRGRWNSYRNALAFMVIIRQLIKYAALLMSFTVWLQTESQKIHPIV